MREGNQTDHDRAFGESLSEPPDYNPVLLDCGQWWAEDEGELIGDKIVCPNCADAAIAVKRSANVQLPRRVDDSEVA
jgi:hypothetical protein